RFPVRTAEVGGALLLMLLLCAAAAPATPTDLGDFVGDTAIYEAVTASGEGLFGIPLISGDTLDFSGGLSTNFEADSMLGALDTIESGITMAISARPGRQLDQVNLEAGGFHQFSRFTGPMTSATSVEARIRLEAVVTEVAGLAVSPVALVPVEQILVAHDFGALTSQDTVNWQGIVRYDLSAAAQIQTGITAPITGIDLAWRMTLTAESEAGTRSRIALRTLDTVALTIVPEPSGFALLTIAGIAVLSRGRRKMAAA
ncbi:MAG: hypothetical protein AAGL98_01400, partial [Planctomycetota bacterium]